MSSTIHALTFTISKKGEPITKDTLSQPVIRIGHKESANIRLDHPSVSRLHAIIEGDTLELFDLGSVRGTSVNGEKINHTVIKNGDIITIGDFDLFLEIE